MINFEKLTISFAHWAYRPKESAVIGGLKSRLEDQFRWIENDLTAIRPDVYGRTWRITYHPIYKPLRLRTLSAQISLSAVIALHTKAENDALANLMRSGWPITWRGHRRSSVMSRAFALNANPKQLREYTRAPALMLVHESREGERMKRKEGHGLHAFLPEIEAHVRHHSNLVAWEGFSYEARRALILATGQKRGRKHSI